MTPRPDEDLPALLLSLADRAPGPCLLIGGLALVEYGIFSATCDVDLAVPEQEAVAFDRLLPLLSYRKIEETHCAARYRHSKSLPDLDLLIFSGERFQRIHKRGIEGKCGLRVPNLEDWRALVSAMPGKPVPAHARQEMQTIPTKIEVEQNLRGILKQMHETFDPIRYVIHRQEECPLPAKL